MALRRLSGKMALIATGLAARHAELAYASRPWPRKGGGVLHVEVPPSLHPASTEAAYGGQLLAVDAVVRAEGA